MVDLANNLRELRPRIGHALAVKRRKQSRQRRLRCQALPHVLQRGARLGGRKGQLGRCGEMVRRVCGPHDKIEECVLAFAALEMIG